MIENRIFRRGFAVLTFFTVLAGDALRYSLTWYGWAGIALALAAIGVILLVQARGQWRLSRLPYPLLAFVVLAFASTAWSDYPEWTLVGAFTTLITVIGGVALAITIGRAELLWALGCALRIIVGLSLLFELVISVFVHHPILPWWTNYGTQKIHAADYWSRDLLFTGDRIQGIVGNSNLLGFVALLALIVFAIQLAARLVRLGWGIFWLVVAAACIALTRSATVTVALVAVVVVAIALLLIRSRRTTGGRIVVYAASLVVVAAAAVLAFVHRTQLLNLLGKSGNLTGRTGIWSSVIALASQRPVAGWGWVSYWVPFIQPFKGLAVINGVQYLQAHEAWLDVWLQLGIIGIVVFAALVLSAAVRAWELATDRPVLADGAPDRYSATSMLPILILVALLAQSLAESRLLIEYGLLLLVVIAVKTKHPDIPPGP